MDVRLLLKSLSALSFIPAHEVEHIFETLAVTFPHDDKFNQILTYFSSTYIRGPLGRPALFPINVWNHFVAAKEETPKTTNACEGFHNALNAIFNCSHPSIWSLFDGIEKDISFQRLILVKAQSGIYEVKKRKYQTLSAAVATVVEGYHGEIDKLKDLRRVANLQ